MLEKLNSASRSEFLKVWSMDHLHQNHIGQRFSNCSLGFIGYKINLVGWLSIFIKKKRKEKNRKLWNRTEYTAYSKSIGFLSLCLCVCIEQRNKIYFLV